MDNTDREWNGSPMDVQGTIDFRGIREIVIEFDSGDSDVFRPRKRQEFHAYELHEMAAYLAAVMRSIRKGENV